MNLMISMYVGLSDEIVLCFKANAAQFFNKTISRFSLTYRVMRQHHGLKA